MDEPTWLTTTDLWPMWHYLAGRELLTDRKRRLVAVPVVRRVAHLLTDPRHARMPDACEAFADGRLPTGEFVRITREAFDAGPPWWDQRVSVGTSAMAAAKWLGCDDTKVGRAIEFVGEGAGWAAVVESEGLPAEMPTGQALRYFRHPAFLAGQSAAHAAVADLLRETFGNPFRPTAAVAAWRTETVLALAQAIYVERGFDRLPILADALQDAGCDDAGVTAHCRGPGGHVRGCWVLDSLLGFG